MTDQKKSKQTPQDGDFVTVHYTGRYENGVVFDSTKNKGPLTFQIGKNKVMKAFEEVIKTMHIGEKRKITLPPEKAYGKRNPKLIESVPRQFVEQKARIFLGNKIALNIPYTNKIYEATIIYFDDTIVTLDLNPPMAGHWVTFEIELLNIESHAPQKQ